MLKRQLERLAAHGLTAFAATELEFILFRTTYEDAWNNAYRGLTPANQYNNDYSILGTARVEPVIRKIRNTMEAAGIQVENSKGECNLGQHEINFAYRDALTTADQHVIYKEAAKEIAAEAGHALTFMAKFNEREGNSCHTHLSLRDAAGNAVFLDGTGTPSKLFSAVSRRAAARMPRRSPYSLRPTSTPTNATPPAALPPPRLPGAWTTAPAPSACWATANRCAWRTACRAAM